MKSHTDNELPIVVGIVVVLIFVMFYFHSCQVKVEPQTSSEVCDPFSVNNGGCDIHGENCAPIEGCK